MENAGSGGEFITLARVLKTQGRHGEVAVQLHSDVPERFVAGMKMSALASDGVRRAVQVEEFWPHKGHLVLKFAGVDSISAAQEWVGSELQVPAAERALLDEGWSYISDLAGCLVWNGDREIGKVVDVQFGAGEAPLLMVKGKDQTYEIPYAQAYLKDLDVEGKRIQMQLPEGMLELNAPLTTEEKQQQKAER